MSPLCYTAFARKRISNSIISLRINNQITAPELRVIDEQGESIGVMSKEEALRLREERGTDLIEIAPHAHPPVARLISFDKYRYQREKEEKKARQSQKQAGLKHVQVSARAAENDIAIKASQAEKFLNEGHNVEIRLRLRGREKYNRPWALERLKLFLGKISVEYKALGEPKFGGFGLNLQIIKK